MTNEHANTADEPLPPPDQATKNFLVRNFMKEDGYISVLTPILAKYILRMFNTRNRSLVKKARIAYDSDMSRNLWIGPTTDAVGFAYIRGDELNARGELDDTPGIPLRSDGQLKANQDGTYSTVTKGPRVALINGQHRCTSVAATDKPQKMLWAVALPLAARAVVDGGQGRKSADQMQLDGVTEPSRSDAIAKALDHLFHRQVRKLSTPAVQSYLREWHTEIAWTLTAVPANKVIGTPYIAAAFTFAYRAAGDDLRSKIQQAAEGLHTGALLAPDSPILIFKNACADQANGRQKRRNNIKLMLRALNALAAVIREETMTAKRKGAFPESEEGYKFFASMIASRMAQPADLAA